MRTSLPTSGPLNALRDGDAFLWLFAIELGSEAFYLVKNRTEITWDSKTWKPWPITIGEFGESGSGELPSTTITLANVGGLLTTHLESGSLEQAPIEVILVHSSDLVSTEALRFRWVVQNATEIPAAVSLRIGMPDFYRLPFPRRRFIRANGFPGIPKVART